MQPVDTRALISLIAGVTAFMFALAIEAWLFVVALPLGIVSLWTGIAVLREGRPGMGISVAGIVLATIAICVWILTTL